MPCGEEFDLALEELQQKMRDHFINRLTSLVEDHPSIVLITGDLGFGVLDEFQKKYPENFINAGVAEQNMTGIAAGMALEGKIVFTYSIANFPILRCLEQIRNDACYHETKCKYHIDWWWF